ncbi:hypothetical protein GQX74_011204 [Glossina fuscipes]|nr:hypothetical protein GQX74_011204 [Glossina fuscipes]
MNKAQKMILTKINYQKLFFFSSVSNAEVLHLASRELFKSLYLDSEQSNSTVIVDINRSVTLISSTFWVKADCLRDNLNDFGTGSKKMCLYCFYINIMLARHASFSGYTFLGFFSYRFAATTREAFAVFGIAAPPSQRFRMSS